MSLKGKPALVLLFSYTHLHLPSHPSIIITNSNQFTTLLLQYSFINLEQIAVIQMLIVQASLEGEGAVVLLQPNTRSNVDVAKLPTFNGEIGKVLDFLTVCRLFIRIIGKRIS